MVHAGCIGSPVIYTFLGIVTLFLAVCVWPSPATHAIPRLLKAGDSGSDTLDTFCSKTTVIHMLSDGGSDTFCTKNSV